MALLLERGGLRTTLLTRSLDQAEELTRSRHNERYLPGVKLPRDLRVRLLGADQDDLRRADLVMLGVPSKAIAEVVGELLHLGVGERSGIVSLAKGLVPPDGTPPTIALEEAFGPSRVACVGGPAHAREMVETGAGLVAASHLEVLAHSVAEAFQAGRVVCEVSDDPVGVELAGVAKNAAAVAVGATQAQGLNAAGMAAADIFLEVLALAHHRGGQAKTSWGGPARATWWPPRLRPARATAGRRAAGPGGARRRDPGPGRPGGGGTRDGEAALRGNQARGARGAGGVGARPPHRGNPPARRLGEHGPGSAAGARALRKAAPRPPRMVGAAHHLDARTVLITASRIRRAMKQDTHPEYIPAHVRCTCGNEFWTRSTKGELHVEICSNCHPFYTGRQKLVDTGGRVERFRRRAARSR